MMTPSARPATLRRLLRRGDAEADGEGRGGAGAEPGDEVGQLRAHLLPRPRDAGHGDAVDEGGRSRGDEVEARVGAGGRGHGHEGYAVGGGQSGEAAGFGGEGRRRPGGLIQRQVRDHQRLDAG